MLVQMDEMDVIDMLTERVGFWTDDTTTLELFRSMYTNYVEDGVKKKLLPLQLCKNKNFFYY